MYKTYASASSSKYCLLQYIPPVARDCSCHFAPLFSASIFLLTANLHRFHDVLRVAPSNDMVATEILDVALRGGEAARVLEQKSLTRLNHAESQAKHALQTAPDVLANVKTEHETLLANVANVNTMIDMLAESLEEITSRTRQMSERSRADVNKKHALDELAIELAPFVLVADVLNASDDFVAASFSNLQKMRVQLHNAIPVALSSPYSQLNQRVTDLEQKVDEITAMMKIRYMDFFVLQPAAITIRGPSSLSISASAILAEAAMLEDALQSIYTELLRSKVAESLSQCNVFFSSIDDDTFRLEWSTGDDPSAELLEFDPDDLDTISEDDIDLMSDHLDISNTAARALKVYDLFRDQVTGPDYSRQLAKVLQPWFSDHILPSSVISQSFRVANRGPIPPELLRSRIMVVTVCSKVLRAAMHARGATSFQLNLDIEALEETVGAESRAQAVLLARRAISSFSDARHDDSAMVECPLSANSYIPRLERLPDYFPSCLVTHTAVTVHNIFLATRADCKKALRSGSSRIACALNAAAVECLRAYRVDIPIQHSSEISNSLRLKSLYYNDCLMFAHSCRHSVLGSEVSNGIKGEIRLLEEAANKVMKIIRRTAEHRLVENLRAACRNGSLGAYGTLTRIQRRSALSGAVNAMREVVDVFAEVIATELAEIAGATLLDKYLSTLLNETVALPEISADGCEQIDGILQEADNNVTSLMSFAKSMEQLRNGISPPDIVLQLRKSRKRLASIVEIMNARMESISTAYRSGKYYGLLSREEVEHFLRAIFEDTPLRSSFISDLDVSLEQESGEWGDSNW